MRNSTRLLCCTVALCSAAGLAACKSDKGKPAAEAKQSEAAADAAQPKTARSSTGEPVIQASKEEIAMADDFVVRFVDAIESNDINQWAAVLSKARREHHEKLGVMERSYEAWRRGTLTVAKRIREAVFRLEKTPTKMRLTFIGVIVANDPEKQFSMTVKIEDGKMFLDEN